MLFARREPVMPSADEALPGRAETMPVPARHFVNGNPLQPPFPPSGEVPPPAASRMARTVEKGHGRIEKRTLRTTSILTFRHRWPGLAQGFELKRERTIKGVTTVETDLGITSLGPEKADATRLLQITRDHWRIENNLHWVRDVTFGEDACRVRSGTAPQVLAALRNTVIHMLREVKAKSRATAIRTLGAHPDQALKLLGMPPFE